ncbi:DUF1349 domain-containing protein [Candidatus Gracilibacteria bacterium]|nr:DUF1349 domain-containing protein [Candidatus Gracilibacteria bacterium]NJM89174.1 DUF1349 domain-containing protein [Hydrococcus sp. RU_2_2]NJP21984.1 DUF1349 domain-containing protein [Hydrococcus sp. CRU_1_1]NJQ97522.1 DUF1349 domain-containing protein [Hydrococcus sp. CSU_1_8]
MKRQIAIGLAAAPWAIASAAIAMTAMTVMGVAVATNDMTTEDRMVSNETKIDDLRSLSTRFDHPEALQGWRELQVEGWVSKWETPKVENGQLVLRPKSSGWFEDNKAGHLYREVTGDFIVTTRLKVQGTNATLPQRSFSLAGLFIRAPRTITKENWTPKGENWLFFSIGTAFPAGSPHFEIKSTYNSVSTLKISEAKEGWVRLRVARSGELFTLLYQEDGSREWKVLEQFIRPDLPETLNVGLTAYADWDSLAPDHPNYQKYNERGAATQNADLIAFVESIDFRRPVTPRFPVATLDPKISFDPKLSEARLRDLTAD